MPIGEALEKYIYEDNSLFCMPGHKQGKGFSYDEQKINFLELFIKGDLTEVEGLDNLHKPEGVIKKAADLLSQLYGSKKSYFLVNGSTSGNLAMIFSSFNEGDKVLVERGCHRSIYNAIVMKKLTPIYIKNKINIEFNAPLSVDMEHFLNLIETESNIKGLIITYPNYYGVCSDLKSMIAYCKSKHIKVLVDAAHGAHFGIHPSLPENPLKLGADMVVMSAHKTLPSLTQTAYLHISESVDEEKVDFYVSAFLSTSPSYMLLLSMDYARDFLQTKGYDEYEKLLNLTSKYVSLINDLENFRVLSRNSLKNTNLDIDLSRLVINVNESISTDNMVKYLRERKIQVEMNDASNIVLIPSPFNEEEDFIRLYRALRSCPIEELKGNQVKLLEQHIPCAYLKPYEGLDKNIEYVTLENSLGRIAAQSICPYPPGVPLIITGEIIDNAVIDMVKYYLKNNILVMGIKEDLIPVIDID